MCCRMAVSKRAFEIVLLPGYAGVRLLVLRLCDEVIRAKAHLRCLFVTFVLKLLLRKVA